MFRWAEELNPGVSHLSLTLATEVENGGGETTAFSFWLSFVMTNILTHSSVQENYLSPTCWASTADQLVTKT